VRSSHLLACCIFTCLWIGCSPKAPDADDPESGSVGSDSSGSAAVTIVVGAVPEADLQAKMVAAKDALFQRLSERLMDAMSKGGPAAAILVCQQEAPQIATTVGQQQGVSIGRTGVRLRNPKNEPPAWASDLVEMNTDVPTFVTLSDDKAAALLPIRLQVQCLMCHGPEEQIAPEVMAQLQKSYPKDQATGFSEGDLRGWFWITLDQTR
jgi:hypothetical protein